MKALYSLLLNLALIIAVNGQFASGHDPDVLQVPHNVALSPEVFQSYNTNLPISNSQEEVQNCLGFDGFNDYVQVTDGGVFLPPSITGEAWIWLDSYPFTGSIMGTIFAKYDNSTNITIDYGGYLLYINPSGQPNVVIMSDYLNVNTPLVTSQVLDLNRWYHLSFTYSTSELKLYIDGNLKNSVSNPVVMGNTANHLEIGRLSNKSQGSYPYGYFPGQIEEIRIWNTVLSQDQIRDNMHRELISPESTPNLIANYRFNHTSGVIALDWSASGKNGVLNNMDPATDWITSSAPIPFSSLTSGNWESDSTWNSGQMAPVNAWSRIKINNGVTLNTNKEAITITVAPSGTLDIQHFKILTVTDDFLLQK